MTESLTKLAEVAPTKTLHEKVSEQLDVILRVFNDLETRVKELENDPAIEDLEEKVADLDNRLDDLEDVAGLPDKVEELESDLDELKEALRNV